MNTVGGAERNKSSGFPEGRATVRFTDLALTGKTYLAGRQLAFGSKSSRLERHRQTCKLAVDRQTFDYRGKNTLAQGNNVVFWNPLRNRIAVSRLYVAVLLTLQRSRPPSSCLSPLPHGNKRVPDAFVPTINVEWVLLVWRNRIRLASVSSIKWESVPENSLFIINTTDAPYAATYYDKTAKIIKFFFRLS